MLIRFAYLAILWIFVLSVHLGDPLRHVRRPRRPPGADRGQAQREPAQADARQARPSRRRGAPTQRRDRRGRQQGRDRLPRRGPLLIGRGNDAAIRLDDDYVSTRHARIASSGDQWFVEDLGSTNGTYVGTTGITQPTALQLGSQVRIGKTILELRK